MAQFQPGSKLGLLLRFSMFALFGWGGLFVFTPLMYFVADFLIAAALGTFAAAAVANALCLRIYERGQLAHIGMHWNRDSRRNLLLGLAGGAGAALLVVVPPLLVGAASLQADPDYPAGFASFFFVTLALLFGAVGEELLFRGYGFQILLARLGPFATILPFGVVFGIFHMANQNSSILGVVNTVGWGILLGISMLRSGDLWLPIGLHFGWNWVLPVFGANLSGFSIKIAGYGLQWKAGEIWSGGAYGPEASILTSIILGALNVYLWVAPVRTQEAFLLVKGRKEA